MTATCRGVASFRCVRGCARVPRTPQKKLPLAGKATPTLREGGTPQGRGELRDQPRRRESRPPTARGRT
ncbi:hypothetical protein SBRY_20455 [Actinacidiphila bryophytorum]|uniref:Uncharacterized protein n=1 Tax=Actinacidiphila bryophytorum TaxID=1436133 RepID=A0A9W4E623_9ACTN|nr:hypothetical protein SBRY_20455 [Actinacidiphila bryophytorum]